jgi:long-chain acyl-CoA synthetase
MKSIDPLLAAWAETLTRQRDRPAIYDETGAVTRTFAEIEHDSHDLARTLEIAGSGSTLAIQIGNHPDWPGLLLACLRKGVVVLPLEQSISAAEREAALKICGVSALATATRPPLDDSVPLDQSGINPGNKRIEIISLTTPISTDRPKNEASLLKFTSGTTAQARAICFRSAQLIADCEQICDTMEITERDLNLGVIPISHSYGFSNLLTPLLVRGVPLVLSQDRLPRALLDNLARTNATVFPGMPVFYQAFCEMRDLPSLPKLRLYISAGAPLPATVAKKFAARFKQPIHSFYGASECGGICYDREGTNFEDGFVGAPMKGVLLEMIDADSLSSQVEVRSRAVGESYFPDPDTKKLGNGIFIPDDLLERHKNGFKIVGRISDVINVAGKKVNPAEVEAVLLALPGIREAIVFGRKSPLRNEEVAACVVANASVSEADVLQSCRVRLSGWQVPKRVFILKEIPVNERGKTSRRELAQRFADR